MIRKIIKIDEEKCNGCGACADACHEGAIEMINGKAKLTRENYCDGLGDCLPACPTNAITFEEREAPAYDEKAVIASKEKKSPSPCGCAGTASKTIIPPSTPVCPETASKTIIPPSTPVCPETASKTINFNSEYTSTIAQVTNQLRQWPVQIKLVPIKAPYFNDANLLVAADCTAYAYGSFHNEFMRNHITIIGCPKLDSVDYTEKLTAIISNNNIKSVTVARMEVPCCGGIEFAVKKALQASGKFIPWRIVTISTDGIILD